MSEVSADETGAVEPLVTDEWEVQSVPSDGSGDGPAAGEVNHGVEIPDLSLKEEPSDSENAKRSLPNGFSGKSGVTPQSLALPDGEGSLGGMGESFTPNLNTGTGTFSVPIAIPPGRRGVQPQLGLAYTTGSGDGPLGWGWGVGAPTILRQSDKGLPRYDDTDRFIYNGGQELVPIADLSTPIPSDEAWPAGWEPSAGNDIIYYRARLEGAFMRFFYNRTADTWLVQDRQGNHYYFGEASSEKITGPKGTYQWNLSRQADARRAAGAGGNDVLYRYVEDGNNLYVSDIYWNSYEQEYGRGNEAKYQHNVHFVWETRPDKSASYAAGFRIEQNLRLRAIRVGSYQYAPSGTRPLTRIYLFNYYSESESFHSRLEHIQVCGRDWDGSYAVHDDTAQCMPALTFGYSEYADLSGGTEPITGFGHLNGKVKALVSSPDVSAADENVDLLDVNQDGLPDVFVTKPDYGGFGNDHSVIFNDGQDFADGVTPHRIDNPAGWSLNLENMNVQVLDMDGTGNADLLHMPYSSEYHYYKLLENGFESDDVTKKWKWSESDDIPLNDAIDFTDDSLNIRLVDLNNDHLIDVVRSTGTRMEYFFNLSGDAEHLGQFGRFDEDTGAGIPNEPVTGCLLRHGTVLQMSDANVQFADMNGDGIQDIVDLTSGDIAYWPGRGWGQFGDSEEDCVEGEIVDGTEIEMSGNPWFSNPDNEGVLVADVNGDGLSDLVQIRFDAVDVWLNRDGGTFTSRHIIDGTPYINSGDYGKVRLADMNGSGTVDIVWTDAGGWQYLDLGGDYTVRDPDLEVDNTGLPAGLLEQTDNGVGATTFMQYAASTELMVSAREEEANPWRTVAPMPTTVIQKVITRDHLEKLGGPAGRYAQEFIYRDPYYDAAEAEFKGFGYAEAWDREKDAGDLCSTAAIERGEAPLVARNWFHRGVRPECMEPPLQSDGNAVEGWPGSWGPKTDLCAESLHDDNPLLGLQGASIFSDTYSPCTTKVIGATVSEIEVRRLYQSVDGDLGDDRWVTFVVPNQGRIYKYDPNPTAPQSPTAEPDASSGYKAVKLSAVGYSDIPNLYLPVAPVGSFHMVYGNTVMDSHGYPTEAFYGGFKRYSDADLYKYANCDQYSEQYEVRFDPSTWVHTATHSQMIGATQESPSGESCDVTQCTAEKPCNVLGKTYNTYGDMVSSVIGAAWDYDGETEITPFMAIRKSYNSFGQVTDEWAGCDLSGTTCKRHTANAYTSEDEGDEHYSAFIRRETAYVPDAAVTRFNFLARWDAGLAQITQTVSADGSEGLVMYDSLGRFSAAYGPRLDTGALCMEAPTKWVEYRYGDGGSPMSALVTHVNTSQARCGHDPWEADPKGRTGSVGRVEELYTFIDALGKPYAQIAPGDRHLGSAAAFPWVINGKAFLNAKGKAWKTCEGTPISNPSTSPTAVVGWVDGNTSPSNCSVQQYDAYGRPTLGIAPDGTMTRAVYRIDEGDAYDHLDLTDTAGDHSNCPNQGTYSTQRVDGLGRTVATISRFRDPDCSIVAKWTTARFDAVGGPKNVTTSEDRGGEFSNSYSRRAQYDSLGRLRVNLDLNFGKWEYRYDELGQLTGATSPTGDVSQYFYDLAGRVKSEVVNGNEVARYYYDAFPTDDQLFGAGGEAPVDWPDSYPAYAITKGRLVAVVDGSGASVSAADYGTVSESWRYVAPDSTRTYHVRAVSDYAGQLVVAEDPDGHTTTAEYYADGTGKSTYWSNTSDAWAHRIVADSRTNMFGQVEWVQYGDAANTQSWTGYDPVMHRPLATTVQQIRNESDTSDNQTLIAFGYQYDGVGKLVGVADFRGRPNDASHKTSLQTTSWLQAKHPTEVMGSSVGSHMWSLPGSFDGNMTAPPLPVDASDLDIGTTDNPGTLWPRGAVPSDAVFTYDTQYQLVGEDREYASGENPSQPSGTDKDGAWTADSNGYVGGKRLEAVDWEFDARGSMSKWAEDESSSAPSASWGRALGSTIQNGWQLNSVECNNWYGSPEHTEPPTSGCYLPDALYHANNIGDVPEGRATCMWAAYDAGGRMTDMWTRTGCSSCEFVTSLGSGNIGADDAKVMDASECASRDASGTYGELDYQPPLDTVLTHFAYSWNALGQLEGAARYENGSQKITMTYRYDAGGSRVIREKSDVEVGNVRQDLYLGGYERRQVEFQDDLGNARSITSAEGLAFVDVDGTRLVKYASGARVQWKYKDGKIDPTATPQIFLTLTNHLGSTSAVVDYLTGALVEWKTNYAYGADESGWKNSDPDYDNADEPYGFTGKEEDTDIGLHYFGARYYSSYIARWLGPDPPVVHGGGMSNHFGYGANSPYIYVDPDGNWIEAIIGAIVGAIQGGRQYGSAGGVIWGAIKGAGTTEGNLYGGAFGGAGCSASFNAIEYAWQKGQKGAVLKGALAGLICMAGNPAGLQIGGSMAACLENQGDPGYKSMLDKSFASGLFSGMVSMAAGGGGIGGSGWTSSIGSSVGQAVAQWAASTATSIATHALMVEIGLAEEDWEGVFISAAVSAAATAVSCGVSGSGASGGGREGDTGSYYDDSSSGVSQLVGSSSMEDRSLVEDAKENQTLVIVGIKGTDKYPTKNLDIAREWKLASKKGSEIADVSAAKSTAEAAKIINESAKGAQFDRIYYLGHGNSEKGILLGHVWMGPKSEGWSNFTTGIKSMLAPGGGVGFYACRLGASSFLSNFASQLGREYWVGGFSDYLGISDRSPRAYWTASQHVSDASSVPTGAEYSSGPWGGFNDIYNEPYNGI